MRRSSVHGLWVLVVVGVLGGVALPAAAEEVLEGMQGEAADVQEPARPMSAEEQAAMAAWMKAMTPGKPHEVLARGAGTWAVEVKFWDQPGSEPTVSRGTAERTMILGGRILQERYHGEFMGMPFDGLGLTGFDNLEGLYWNTWMDTMGTGMMKQEGHCTADGSSCTFLGSFHDPGADRVVFTKSVVHYLSPDRQVYESFTLIPEGGDQRTMEVTYTRKP
jgi:hypothetical protein